MRPSRTRNLSVFGSGSSGVTTETDCGCSPVGRATLHGPPSQAIGFERKDEAERCRRELRKRFTKFGLRLHDTKTRLIEFGRHAASRRKTRGESRPETFDLLGFTHRCGVTCTHGWYTIHRETTACDPGGARSETSTATTLALGADGSLAASRHSRLAELSRCARQHAPDAAVPLSFGSIMATTVASSFPTFAVEVRPNVSTAGSLLSGFANPASLS